MVHSVERSHLQESYFVTSRKYYSYFLESRYQKST